MSASPPRAQRRRDTSTGAPDKDTWVTSARRAGYARDVSMIGARPEAIDAPPQEDEETR